MHKTKKVVKQFKKEFSIKDRPTSYKLKRVIERLSFTVCGYHADADKLRQIKREKLSRQKPAFTYIYNDEKYIMIT